MKIGLASIFFLLVVIAIPHGAHAASATFFGPIVPAECHCEAQVNPDDGNANTLTTAPDYGCVLQTLQNAINFGVSMGIILFTLYLVYAGARLVMSGGSPGAREQARTRLTNVIVGMVVLLCSWIIVDYVMKTLYHDEANFGPWNSILAGKADNSDRCIVSRNPSGLTTGTLGLITSAPGGTTSTGGYTGTGFTYQTNVKDQVQYESPALATLLTCMAGKLPAGVGEISAITEVAIANQTKSISQCAATGYSNGAKCAHSAGSCHYGGKACVGSSYAVDFGDGDPEHPANLAALKSAASSCGANFQTDNENGVRNHLHVSVGAACGCN